MMTTGSGAVTLSILECRTDTRDDVVAKVPQLIDGFALGDEVDGVEAFVGDELGDDLGPALGVGVDRGVATTGTRPGGGRGIDEADELDHAVDVGRLSTGVTGGGVDAVLRGWLGGPEWRRSRSRPTPRPAPSR
ncbi:hypothetical protein FNH05_04745 [Amycolatopsis rhizosphaerae]|uniref:Uncharacterized protein n=1 Tax=Amycolatopsis rhizosphaerae TaxID=2053003 RepID=A0A558DGR5_9PSEU|nr:hypothetical protein [Amycolatopsis rhizosphaerae]TVT60217.1 hypothetical protein FNH05_04745 [Amycolatopsis rhizosphaerae]